MASRWYCRFFEGDRGPLTFDELAQLIRIGKLTERDLVRREGIGDWQPAESVVGLFHRARKSRANVARPSKRTVPVPEVEDEEEDEGEPFLQRLSGLRIAALAVVLVAVGVGLWFAWTQKSARTKFPLTARFRAQAAEIGLQYFFLGWGPLNVWEYAMIWFNVIAFGLAALFVIWRCFRPRPQSS